MDLASIVFSDSVNEQCIVTVAMVSAGRLNIKVSSYQYRDTHVKVKMVSRPSYL